MNKYRKKPIVVEAVQYNGSASQVDELEKLIPSLKVEHLTNRGVAVSIDTLEGTMVVTFGDWIIKGINGEFYPCKPDIFEKTYEALEDEEQSEDVVHTWESRHSPGVDCPKCKPDHSTDAGKKVECIACDEDMCFDKDTNSQDSNDSEKDANYLTKWDKIEETIHQVVTEKLKEIEQPERTQWGYSKVSNIPWGKWKREMSSMGENGWELVAVDDGVAYFKRKIQNNE